MSLSAPPHGSYAEVSPGRGLPGPAPDATLYYEQRGSGPMLVLAGTPFGTGTFAGLAQLLAIDRTVLTYDPRGTGRSVSHTDDYADTPELRAADLYQLLSGLTDEPVDLFGGSGGAMTGLALVTKYPDRVRTLIAHEPPVTALLPEATELRAQLDEMVATFHDVGSAAAWVKFLSVLGEPSSEDPVAEPTAAVPTHKSDPDGDYFLSRMVPNTPRYRPDLAALRAAHTRILVAVGADSDIQLPRRAALALARQLHLRVVEFPGDHVGYFTHPDLFARRLRQHFRKQA